MIIQDKDEWYTFIMWVLVIFFSIVFLVMACVIGSTVL